MEFSIVQFGSNALSDLSKLQQSLQVAGHQASIDSEQTAIDSDSLISKTDCNRLQFAHSQ